MVSGRKQVTIIGVITGLIFFSLLVFSTNSAAEEPASDAASVTRSNEAAIDQEVDRRFRSQRGYLLAAYGAVFLILFAYMAMLSSRVRRLFRDVETIRRLVPPGSKRD